MKDAKSVRLCALAGLAFFVLIVVSGPILQTSMPSLTDSSGKIFRYLSTHVGKQKASGALAAFAMAAVLVWLAGHFSSLRKAEGGRSGFAVAALGGGILASAATVFSAAIQAATALRIHDIGLGGARLWFTITTFAGATPIVGLTILVGASAVVFLNNGMYARWFAWASGALAVVDLVGILAIAYGSNALQGIFAIGISLTLIWILVISVLLWRNPERAIA
jgi:hypothetical protein